MVVHPVACVKKVLSMQRQVTFDAAHADCATAVEKHWNWHAHISFRHGEERLQNALTAHEGKVPKGPSANGDISADLNQTRVSELLSNRILTELSHLHKP